MARMWSVCCLRFFDPKVIINPYELKEILIDGGLICNNPTLYAFQIASILKNQENVRILSIGTGEKPFKPVNKGYTKYDWMTKFSPDEFTMNMDVYTAHNYLLNLYNYVFKKPEDYIRLQKVTSIGMDKVDKESIDGLIKDGNDLYEENKDDI